jgi:hypothetical protein
MEHGAAFRQLALPIDVFYSPAAVAEKCIVASSINCHSNGPSVHRLLSLSLEQRGGRRRRLSQQQEQEVASVVVADQRIMPQQHQRSTPAAGAATAILSLVMVLRVSQLEPLIGMLGKGDKEHHRREVILWPELVLLPTGRICRRRP